MPKRYKPNKYCNYSSVLGQGQGYGATEAWDDTELINQFDEALREWKQEKQNAYFKYENSNTEPEEAPYMGAWVEVEQEAFNPETAADFVPALDDHEMTALYDQALEEWKEERKPENWAKIWEIDMAADVSSQTESVAASNAQPDKSTVPGPWVVVNPKSDLEQLAEQALAYSKERSQLIEAVPGKNIPEDREMLTIYDEALQEWREERQPSLNLKQDEEQDQGTKTSVVTINSEESSESQPQSGDTNSEDPHDASSTLIVG